MFYFMYILCLPIHSSVDEHLKCFYLLVIANNAAVNMGMACHLMSLVLISGECWPHKVSSKACSLYLFSGRAWALSVLLPHKMFGRTCLGNNPGQVFFVGRF